jgi:hypothetical protein
MSHIDAYLDPNGSRIKLHKPNTHLLIASLAFFLIGSKLERSSKLPSATVQFFGYYFGLRMIRRRKRRESQRSPGRGGRSLRRTKTKMKTIPAEAVPVQDLVQVQSAAAVAAQPAAEVALHPNATRRRGPDINLLRAQSLKF